MEKESFSFHDTILSHSWRMYTYTCGIFRWQNKSCFTNASMSIMLFEQLLEISQKYALFDFHNFLANYPRQLVQPTAQAHGFAIQGIHIHTQLVRQSSDISVTVFFVFANRYIAGTSSSCNQHRNLRIVYVFCRYTLRFLRDTTVPTAPVASWPISPLPFTIDTSLFFFLRSPVISRG